MIQASSSCPSNRTKSRWRIEAMARIDFRCLHFYCRGWPGCSFTARGLVEGPAPWGSPFHLDRHRMKSIFPCHVVPSLSSSSSFEIRELCKDSRTANRLSTRSFQRRNKVAEPHETLDRICNMRGSTRIGSGVILRATSRVFFCKDKRTWRELPMKVMSWPFAGSRCITKKTKLPFMSDPLPLNSSARSRQPSDRVTLIAHRALVPPLLLM